MQRRITRFWPKHFTNLYPFLYLLRDSAISIKRNAFLLYIQAVYTTTKLCETQFTAFYATEPNQSEDGSLLLRSSVWRIKRASCVKRSRVADKSFLQKVWELTYSKLLSVLSYKLTSLSVVRGTTRTFPFFAFSAVPSTTCTSFFHCFSENANCAVHQQSSLDTQIYDQLFAGVADAGLRMRVDQEWQIFENDFKAVIPESFLILSAFSLLLYGVIYSGSQNHNYPIFVRNISQQTLVSVFFTMLLFLHSPLHKGVLFYNTLVIDDYTLFFKLLLLIGVFFSVLISIEYMQQETINCFELLVLILLSAASMLFLISAADLISMYCTIEMQSLCFYVMSSSLRYSEFCTEAGLKYFLLGAISSGILLFGCCLLYGFTGATNLSEISQILRCGGEEVIYGFSSLRGCQLGMIFICVGLLFKLTAVPFHMWAPDVYEGAPTSVTAFFSIVPKISILAILGRLLFQSFYDFMINWQGMLVFCSVSSMLLGTFAALSQNKIKRLLAFSSIGHVGYILVGFCCGTVEGVQALLIYLLVYIVMTWSFFAVVLSTLRRDLIDQLEISQTRVQRVKYTTDLAMLSTTNPILALSITITLFSIAGIPPLAGFLSKAFLMFAAIGSSQYLLALVAVITSVCSCFYYIRIVKIMYFSPRSQIYNVASSFNFCTFMQVSKEASIALGCALCFLLFLFLYPAPIFIATHKVALQLCF